MTPGPCPFPALLLLSLAFGLHCFHEHIGLQIDTTAEQTETQQREAIFDRDHPPAKVAQEGPRPVMPRNNGLREERLLSVFFYCSAHTGYCNCARMAYSDSNDFRLRSNTRNRIFEKSRFSNVLELIYSENCIFEFNSFRFD